MKYNEKYDRWVTRGGLVYRYSKGQDKLVLCNQSKPNNGYLSIKVSKPKRRNILVHILVWETFNGEIPQGYEIDHIKGNKEDNRLEMLRCVTHHENMLNPVTRNKISVSLKGRTPANKGKTFSEFGEKFKEHFGISRYENIDLYRVEYKWYIRHNNRCSWE